MGLHGGAHPSGSPTGRDDPEFTRLLVQHGGLSINAAGLRHSSSHPGFISWEKPFEPPWAP